METLFNIDEDGFLVISEYHCDPEELPREIRVPAGEFPALRAILNTPGLASCEASKEGAYFNGLSIIADTEGITLGQTPLMGMGGRDSEIELSPAQILPVIHELARLASLWEWNSTENSGSATDNGEGDT